VSFQTGTCALFFASQGGFLDIVKELISHGAPVDLPSYVSPTKCEGTFISHVQIYMFTKFCTHNSCTSRVSDFMCNQTSFCKFAK